MVVDELHDAEDSLDVVLHVRNLNVRDSSTWGKTLELRLKLKLLECVNLFCNVDVVAVSDVALVGNAWDNTKAALKCLSKLVGSGLKRSSVEGVIDILCFLPLGALIVHVLHNLECKWSCLFVSVAVTSHSLNALV